MKDQDRYLGPADLDRARALVGTHHPTLPLDPWPGAEADEARPRALPDLAKGDDPEALTPEERDRYGHHAAGVDSPIARFFGGLAAGLVVLLALFAVLAAGGGVLIVFGVPVDR